MFSVTKSFTGTMILMLAEEGLIDLANLSRSTFRSSLNLPTAMRQCSRSWT